MWAWFHFQVNRFPVFFLSWQVSFSPPAAHRQPNPFNTPSPTTTTTTTTDIYATHSSPKLTNMEDNDKEQADTVEKAFDLEYGVALVFCSHIILKAELLLTGEALDNGMGFGPEAE